MLQERQWKTVTCRQEQQENEQGNSEQQKIPQTFVKEGLGTINPA